MGADHKYDLTSDVTHLLIGAIDTPKYKYVAKERTDVKVLKPEWVDAVREQWLQGEDVDVAALEEEWRAPPFFGLKICLTGFEDLAERNAIAELVQSHGAQYSGDLTRDITHLIAAIPKGKKYEYARSWNIKVVGLEWIRDGIERGLALDEALYDPMISPEERGKGAWRREPIQPTTGKHPRQDDQAQPDNRRRKLRRTVSEKFESQNDAIWADITSATSEHKPADEWNEEPADADVPMKAEPDHSEIPILKRHWQSTRSRKPKDLGIFQGRLVCFHGFEGKKREILNVHLSSNGAILSSHPELEDFSVEQRVNGFLVVPYDTPLAKLAPLPDDTMQQVTEFWVESCLLDKTLVDPQTDRLCRPLPYPHIEGFKGITICSTAFEGVHLLHLSRIVSLVGATYAEYLNPQASVLVCNSNYPNVEKVKFAVEHGIPAVSLAWLEACLETGKIQQPEDFIIPAVHEQTYGYKDAVTIKRQKAPGDDSSDEKIPKGVPRRRTAGFRKPRSPAAEEKRAEMGTAPTRVTAPTLPLQELHPDVNSPSRRSMSVSLSKSNSLSPSKEPSLSVPECATPFESNENILQAESEDDQQPIRVPEPSIDLNIAISALLAQKQASRPSSARDSASEADTQKPRRRKKGLLGRAYSNTSNHSWSAPGSNTLSRKNSIGQSEARHEDPGPATQAGQSGPVPSQALVFEDPSVQHEREQLIRKMGGKVQRSVSVTMEQAGVLKDAGSSEGGVATRVRRRARETRAGAAAGGDW